MVTVKIIILLAAAIVLYSEKRPVIGTLVLLCAFFN